MEECCVCREEIKNDAAMLVPCEHIIHNSCFDGLKKKICPLCRSEPTSVMPFIVSDDWDNPTFESINDNTLLAECPDSELWTMFVTEFNSSIASDDFKSGVDVVLKTLDGTKHTTRVPRNWTFYKLKEYVAIHHSKSHTPCDIRLVVCGSPVNEKNLVIPDNYTLMDPIIVIHMITEIRGS